MICDKKVPMKLKHKMYKAYVRPHHGVLEMMCGQWVNKGKPGYTTDLRMLRWIQGVKQGSYNIPVTKFKAFSRSYYFFPRLNRIGKTLDLLRNACRSKHTFIGWRIM